MLAPKPKGLSGEYGAWFKDPLVVAAYASRPPYPEEAIQTLSDARVAMTEADWALMERSNRAGAAAIPARDIVIKDGDTIRVGDTTVKMYVTPGHTPGVASMEFTVYDGGVPHKAFLFGGHNVTALLCQNMIHFPISHRTHWFTMKVSFKPLPSNLPNPPPDYRHHYGSYLQRRLACLGHSL